MLKSNSYILILLFLLTACSDSKTKGKESSTEILPETHKILTESLSLVVLGNVQDAGSPHMGCTKACCADLFKGIEKTRRVVSLGLVDAINKKQFVFEASPDFHLQCKYLKYLSGIDKEVPDGVFLTHAHIGHYTGLMYLGKEAINADQVPVYAMPRMKQFLETNGPWSQLVNFKNIDIQPLEHKKEKVITDQFKVTPFQVPHRDEYSETVGYRIIGPRKPALFIPDIDKWEKWDKDIIEMIAEVDYAFLDATFYDSREINYRNISEIPHPFAIESMEKFAHLDKTEKRKIHFIHLNHTNPLLDQESEASSTVVKNGFAVARLGMTFEL